MYEYETDHDGSIDRLTSFGRDPKSRSQSVAGILKLGSQMADVG